MIGFVTSACSRDAQTSTFEVRGLTGLINSEVMKSIKNSSTTLINRGRAASGGLPQGRFFDRAQRQCCSLKATVFEPIRQGGWSVLKACAPFRGQ
jgi:hypothetical protein